MMKQIAICKDVENHSIGEPLLGQEIDSVVAGNIVTPYMRNVRRALNLRKGATVDISVVERPKHGKLYTYLYPGSWPAWGYLSEQGYIGHDRVLFLVKANGKELRVVMNLLVGMVQDKEAARCRFEKFSSIEGVSLTRPVRTLPGRTSKHY